MTTEVTVVLKSIKDALIIPSSALITGQDGKQYVQIEDSKGDEKPVIKQVPVTVGLNTNVKAEITSGVAEGDNVIIGAASGVVIDSTGTRRPRGMMF
jgi:macrolide-specific efflux system membrane fusion protein